MGGRWAEPRWPAADSPGVGEYELAPLPTAPAFTMAGACSGVGMTYDILFVKRHTEHGEYGMDLTFAAFSVGGGGGAGGSTRADNGRCASFSLACVPFIRDA